LSTQAQWKIEEVGAEEPALGEFFRSGQELRRGPSARNAPSAAYSALVWAAGEKLERRAWLATGPRDRGVGERRVLGRIAVFKPADWGAVGLFEVDLAESDAPMIAEALLTRAREALAVLGVERVYGPLDCSTWFQYRLRVYDAGFPPARAFAWEPTQPPEYLEYFRAAGFSEAERYHSVGYELNERHTLAHAAALLAPASALARSRGFRFEPLSTPGRGGFAALLERLHRQSARAFGENFLYTPIEPVFFEKIYESIGRSDLSFSFRAVLEANAPAAGGEEQEAGFVFCFAEGDTVVVKSIAVEPRFRKLQLSNALLHQAIHRASLEPKERGLKRFVSALVKSGSPSERIEAKHFDSPIEVWRHDYVLLEARLGARPGATPASPAAREVPEGSQEGSSDASAIGAGQATSTKEAAARPAPGPRGLEALGYLLRRRAEPLAFYEGLRKNYGRFVRLPVGPLSFFVVSDPVAIKHILLDRHRDYVKGPGFERLGLVLGKGLITAEGELWKKQRRLIQPSLSREKLAGFALQLSEITKRLADSWERAIDASEEGNIEVDLARVLMDLSLELVAETLLGSDMRPQAQAVAEAFHRILEHWEALQVSPSRLLELAPRRIAERGWFVALRGAIGGLPSARRRSFEAAVARLDSVVLSVIEEKRRALAGARPGEELPGLVAALLQARDPESGEAMGLQQLRDEVTTFLLAGHETTANGLLWTEVLLTQNPQATRRLEEEIDALVSDAPITLETAARLRWAQAVFEESLRLHPPVWRLTRQASRDDRVPVGVHRESYHVPEGSILLLTPYLVHRDPEFWGEDAGEFRPERFLTSSANSRDSRSPGERAGEGAARSGGEIRPDRFAYLPFGAGPRMCIGNHFALLEAQIVLGQLHRRFEIEVRRPTEIPLAPRITLRPAGAVPARIRRRG
jgi:cytochrome P450